MSKVTRTRKKSVLLQVFLIELKKNLHSGTEAGRLDFPPKSAFVASYTVHNPANISEVLFELLFQNLHKIRQVKLVESVHMSTYVGILTLEKGGFVEFACDPSNFENFLQSAVCDLIIFVGP